MAEQSWNNGDVYFWSWKKPRDHMPYHCCSRKAVIRGGRLKDTFWGLTSDSRCWSQDEANAELTLSFQGNTSELVPINEWEADYYESCDIVDMRHSNSSMERVCRQKNAIRSKDQMLAVIAHKRERAKSTIRHAEHSLELLANAESKILGGADLQEIHL